MIKNSNSKKIVSKQKTFSCSNPTATELTSLKEKAK